MPHIRGSTTPCTKAPAIAASTALPPAFRISAPASVASGWAATIIARLRYRMDGSLGQDRAGGGQRLAGHVLGGGLPRGRIGRLVAGVAGVGPAHGRGEEIPVLDSPLARRHADESPCPPARRDPHRYRLR